MLDAMGDVVAQYLFLDAAERGANRRNLRHDVDAIAILLDHLREAANLALDPAEAFLNGCLDVPAHADYIPLQGIGFKGRELTMDTPEHTQAGGTRACCGGDRSHHGGHHHLPQDNPAARDPVCG